MDGCRRAVASARRRRIEETRMSHILKALAVAGVVALPAAANGQTANVTLYGRLNLDYEVVNGGRRTARTRTSTG
jgi:hypothetical protein